MIFDLTCPEEKAFSYFEVINTCEGPGYGDPDKLPIEELEKNTVDLDPKIVKLIDKHFWELF